MSKLEEFRKLNPQYKILTLDDPSFKEYGVLYTNDFNLDDVYRVMEKVQIPETGMKYIPNIPELADTYTMLAVKRDIFGEIPIDAGVTLGHSDTFTAFEYHQCSEVNIMLDDVLMVLGKRETLEEEHFVDPNTEARMFYMPKGTIVELYNDTLHYAPIQITKKGYKVIVAVIHGTNAVLPQGVKSLNPRVVKRGKFQVVHPSRKDKIAQGYQVGLSGDVIKTTPLDE